MIFYPNQGISASMVLSGKAAECSRLGTDPLIRLFILVYICSALIIYMSILLNYLGQ